MLSEVMIVGTWMIAIHSGVISVRRRGKDSHEREKESRSSDLV